MKFLYRLLILIFASACIFAQEYDYQSALDSMRFKDKFGLFASFDFNIHNADFRSFPTVESCCPKYTDGNGNGFSIGALYEFFLFENNFVGIRGGFSNIIADLKRDETETILIDGVEAQGVFSHFIDAELKTINLYPYYSYSFFDKIFLNAGPYFDILVNSNFSQIEKIKTPADRGTFLDGKSYRADTSGSIPELNTLQFGLNFGISSEFPLNSTNSLRIAPELNFNYRFTDFVKETTWKAHTLRAGLAIKYLDPPSEPPPPAPPAPIPMPELNLPAIPPTISGDISVVEIDSTQKENPNFSLKIEDFTSLNMRPLLNYIFFDENSSELPSRYQLIKKEDIDKFNNSDLRSLNAIETYYQVLNIIAKRLIDNPDTKIELIGNNSNTGAEKNNKDLSMKRAETIKNYFVDVWNIDPKRIKLTARNLPKEATMSEDKGTDDENRRVEIIPSNKEIIEPVMTGDTLRVISNTNLKFIPKVNSSAGLKKWEINVRQNGDLIKKFEGSEDLPNELVWEIKDKDESSPSRPGNLIYGFKATDKLGQSINIDNKRIPVEQLTIDRKRLELREDKAYEHYSLILFDYASSDLGKEHKKVVDFVKSRITPQSTVYITGYTDSMGETDVNQKISNARANAVAKRLKIDNAIVKGVGESTLLYENTTPEARFYCRTVTITIETQVK